MKPEGAPYRCVRHGPPPRFFAFRSRDRNPPCPSCGATAPHVYPLADLHYIVVGSGPIVGQQGRQHVACVPRRDGYCLHRRDQFPCTADPRLVTCQSCQGTKAWKEAARAYLEFDPDFRAQREAEEIEAEVRRRSLCQLVAKQ